MSELCLKNAFLTGEPIKRRADFSKERPLINLSYPTLSVGSGGGPYVLPAITEIARSVSIRIVEPSPEEIKKIEAAVPYLPLGAIPPNKAPGDNADKERKAFFYSTYWTALTSMTDEAAYDFLKLTQDPVNKELLGKIMSFWTSAGPDFGPIAKGGIPLHPGAAKFWLEKRVKLPPNVGK